MGAKIHGIIGNGSSGILVDIECRLSNNLPNVIIVGFANRAVGEARERIRGAFAASRIMLPRKRIALNLAPADVPKDDSGFDLPMAVAIMAADGQITCQISDSQAYIGELGLDGTVRPVRGIIGKILTGRVQGVNKFYVPAGNLPQAQLVPDISLVPVNNLSQLYGYLCLGLAEEIIHTGAGLASPGETPASYEINFSEITGQSQPKRALILAAAGGHNLFFDGPPGTGKSMLAKTLPSIMPPLEREEMLEVTHLHSLSGNNYGELVTARPFRAPHHSASHTAVVGGGARLRPGEISLAHKGVLLFDEMPEFERATLEALRQPLENHSINLANARETADYPANFIMVATANPCPCGYYGSSRACKCSTGERIRYQNRVSGPILDRIDLHCFVDRVDHRKLLDGIADPAADSAARDLVIAARARQAGRFGGPSRLNAHMTNSDVRRFANLTPDALDFLNKTARKSKLSARTYFKVVKVARTAADLADSASTEVAHISEAFFYQRRPAETAKGNSK